MHDQIISGLYTTLINFESHGLQEKDETKKREAPKLLPLLLPSTIGKATSNR
jgi:hypothetical protein